MPFLADAEKRSPHDRSRHRRQFRGGRRSRVRSIGLRGFARLRRIPATCLASAISPAAAGAARSVAPIFATSGSFLESAKGAET
jgi:hypothetical protein